jgi:hypothetical protein
LTSNIYDYVRENGRTYHAFHSGKCLLPNDAAEQKHMHCKFRTVLDCPGPFLTKLLVHYLALRLVLVRSHWIAPIKEPKSIIDVGTGTGIWAMGIDLSPIQPEFVAPNLEFIVARSGGAMRQAD